MFVYLRLRAYIDPTVVRGHYHQIASIATVHLDQTGPVRPLIRIPVQFLTPYCHCQGYLYLVP